MFGLLNVVFRPLGDIIANIITNTWARSRQKKLLIAFCGIVIGYFKIAIRLLNPQYEVSMFGLVAGLAIFIFERCKLCRGAICSSLC